MRHLGGDVDIVGTSGDGIEEIREAVPVPRQAFAQHDLGNVFHALHQVDQHVVLVFVAGREAHAAVAEQHGRGPVPGRRRQPVAPGHLRVVVRVHVDEARRYKLAARVDLLGSLGNVSADRRDLAVDDGEVGFIGVAAGPIDDGAVANHQAGRGHADGSNARASIVPAGEQPWQTGRRSSRAHVACVTRMCHCRPERSEG